MICRLCDARCCKERLITITVFDALRIEKHSGISAKEFAFLSPPRIINIDYEYLLECDEGSRLLAIKSYPCYFLKENRCSIYKYAPLICKLYPFSPNGNIVGMCPLHAKVLFKLRGIERSVVERYLEEDVEYRRIVAEWNSIWKSNGGDEKRCWDFIFEEGKKRLPRGGFEPPTSRSPS